jgi:hypothetical protein|tara:strand:+ start:1011 stop:1511 length:501 start_codon:yes stop_codon:yes gene_type:complete
MSIQNEEQVEVQKIYKQVDGDEWKKEVDTQRNQVEETLNEPRYLLSIFESGDVVMSSGDRERQVSPNRSYLPNCSMQEVAEHIKSIGESHWRHPMLKTGMSEKSKSAIPFEEKQWGIVRDINIYPMTEYMEEKIKGKIERGFFKNYRRMYGTGQVILDISEREEVS